MADTTTTHPSRTWLAVGAALVLALLTPGCGSDRTTANQAKPATPDTSPRNTDPGANARVPTTVQAIDITGTEYAFDIRTVGGGALRPGWTKVTFHNGGVEAHQVMFARLKDGVDMAQLAATAGGDSSGSKAIEFVDMLGGVSYVGNGKTVEAMVNLPEGVVLAMCYVPDPKGVAHALSGMTTVLTIDGKAGVGAPATDGTAPANSVRPTGSGLGGGDLVQGTIVMDAEGYHMPRPMPAGWYHVVNRDSGQSGKGLHELSILGLEDRLEADGIERLLADIAANRAPSVAIDALGGMGALSAGFEGYLYLDLAPGPYLAVDFMPDPGDPRPHLLDGYVGVFEP